MNEQKIKDLSMLLEQRIHDWDSLEFDTDEGNVIEMWITDFFEEEA